MTQPLIDIRTGSDSDIPKIRAVYDILNDLEVGFTPRVLSAHRTPNLMVAEAQQLQSKGYRVCIAAAGGSAHLPGMTASETILPVIGIPVETSYLQGVDSLYSIVQMPGGIPVGTVGVGDAKAAGLLAAQIGFQDQADIRNRVREIKGLAPLAETKTPQKTVKISIPADTSLNEDRYEAMMNLGDVLGVTFDIHTYEKGDHAALAQQVSVLEKEGISSLIVLGADLDDAHWLASQTDIPVIGLPLSGEQGNVLLDHFSTNAKSEAPIAGMGTDRYINAALFAAQIIGLYHPDVQEKLLTHRRSLATAAQAKDTALAKEGIEAFL